MTPNNSELWAGALVLILILAAAAVLLPPAFAQWGGEWVAIHEWAVQR